jgi:hypothetical protein
MLYGGRVFKAEASLTQIPASNGASERTEIEASCTGNQTMDVTPEATVVQPRPTPPDLQLPPWTSLSPLEGNADIPEFLTEACVVLTRRILTMA